MQIDTKNRHYNGSDFKPDIMPAASLAPPDAPYSGLLECPCTDRIVKKVEQTYGTKTFGSCIKTVVNASECFEAAEKVVTLNTILRIPKTFRGNCIGVTLAFRLPRKLCTGGERTRSH